MVTFWRYLGESLFSVGLLSQLHYPLQVTRLNTKTRIAIFSVILIAALVVSAFDAVKLLTNQYTLQAQKIFEDAKTQVEKIRGVTLPSVTLHIITKQQAVDKWGHPSGSQDLTNILRQEKIYKGLFMMQENDSLVQTTSDWTANWIAAAVGHDVYLLKENFNPFDKNAEATLVHELTHIWQPSLETPTTYDEDKAHTALVEGDASFMADYYINLTAHVVQASVNMPFFLVDNPLLDAVHPISNTMWSLNYMPYDQGKSFVGALYDKGGFALINQAYQQGYTPSSTMQILHVDKYFANETVQTVPSPMPDQNSWTLTQTDRGQDHNTYGEYFIQTMLATWLNQSASQQAATGWAGDNFTYYEHGDDYLFTWNITWTSVNDASEFSYAFSSMMNQTSASPIAVGEWQTNGRTLTLTWNPTTASTFIACSTVESATLPSDFA